MIRNGELIPEDSHVFKESVKEARVFEDDIISSRDSGVPETPLRIPSFLFDLVTAGGLLHVGRCGKLTQVMDIYGFLSKGLRRMLGGAGESRIGYAKNPVS